MSSRTILAIIMAWVIDIPLVLVLGNSVNGLESFGIGFAVGILSYLLLTVLDIGEL